MKPPRRVNTGRVDRAAITAMMLALTAAMCSAAAWVVVWLWTSIADMMS